MTSDLDSISSGDQISAIKKELDEALNGFSLLSDRVKQDKNQDIKDMINYYGNLTKNIEDRRIHLADVAWQSLAISFTALGIILAVHIPAIFKIPNLIGIIHSTTNISSKNPRISSAILF